MYSQVIRNLLVINSHNLPKCMSLKRLSCVTSKAYPLSTRLNYKPDSINFRLFASISPPDKDEIAQKYLDEHLKDPENERNYKILQLEIDVMRQSGEQVPTILKPRHWMELVQTKSLTRRKKYLHYVFMVEKKKENNARKKQENHLEFLNKKVEKSDIPIHLQYKLGGNALFYRLYDTQINYFYNWKLIQAIMYGQKLVFDCGFEDAMNRMELRYCARQLQFAFAANRICKDPFDLHFCNLDLKGFLHRELHSYIPTLHEPHFPLTITEKSYLDLFDKDKLVYLTPDCNETLETFDHNATYIIGAIVDKVSGVPWTLAKAKRENLQMAKLPIDQYLNFGGGSGKALTLNQMVDILADIKQTGDWAYALRHVPKRKLFGYRQHANQRRLEKMLQNNQTSYAQSSSPQDYSLKSRNKFRTK